MALNRLIIPDLHGNADALLWLMARAGAIETEEDGTPVGLATYEPRRVPGWWVCQVGDLANFAPWQTLYRDFIPDDATCLRLAAEGLFDVLLVGNHEIPFTHNIGYWSGMATGGDQLQPETMRHLGTLVHHLGQYKAAIEVDGHLVTHAGLHPHYAERLSRDPAEVAEELNSRLWKRAMREPGHEIDPVFDEVGFAVGGPAPRGGIVWLRPAECQKWKRAERVPYPQIVGHSVSPDHPRWVEERRMLYIDNGGYSPDRYRLPSEVPGEPRKVLLERTGVVGLVKRAGDTKWTPVRERDHVPINKRKIVGTWRSRW